MQWEDLKSGRKAHCGWWIVNFSTLVRNFVACHCNFKSTTGNFIAVVGNITATLGNFIVVVGITATLGNYIGQTTSHRH
jgi:hypothetical protein